MAKPKIPLLGLLEDVLLPGEDRVLGAPALDGPHRRALAGSAGRRVAFVTITSPAELPSLVTGRFATEAEVLKEDGETFLVRGLSRVKLGKVLRQEPPYEAEVEPATDTPDLPAVFEGLKALADALAAGAEPEGGEAKVREAAAAVLRATVPAKELGQLLAKPLPEVLREAAAVAKARAPAFAGEKKLEAVARALSTADAQTPEQRRRLWSQVVEVQKKLDIFDPAMSGGDGDDLVRLERRLKQAGLPPEAREMAKRELKLLKSMTTHNSEMSTYLAHLELVARLPWHPSELPPVDLAKVQATLDREHAGMEKVKRRVLEFLAVRALGGSSQSTVLCLSGPPGTGKTTIARAMAEALGRPFGRVALGGVHDECELRGHRPSFVAASCGRILQAVASAGSQSALVLLDEIDKLGTELARSPMGALLEALDPEQHGHFSDHFLQVPFDLSHVFFVCTANDLNAIHPVLRDRLEVVELEGYSVEEKVRLVRSHLLPRVAKSTGVPAPEVADPTLVELIEGHTREAGLRQLQRCLAAILRARALAKVKDGADLAGPITPAEIERALGRGRVPPKKQTTPLPPGTAFGLSVSGEGGALLPIEVLRLPGGKGKPRLELTGRLGTVLQESVRAVLSHLKHRAAEYGIPAAAFEADLHVHLPDGATPKDGPSAGVALGVALASALSDRPVRPDIAFTGELTLAGRVTAVGGVRAKVLAAERAGLADVVLPAENRNDLPDALRVRAHPLETLADAMRLAFAPETDHAASAPPDPAAAPVAARGA